MAKSACAYPYSADAHLIHRDIKNNIVRARRESPDTPPTPENPASLRRLRVHQATM
jgi:hypothetical protein